MPPEIVRSQLNPGFLDDDPRCSIGDRENPVLRLDRLVLQVRPQPVNHLSGNEYDLRVLAAFWALDGKLLVVYISGSELQDFTDPHPSSGHQFQDEPVSQLCRSEDDFVDRLLLDNVPVNGLAGSVDSPQHRGITRVLNGGIKIGLDEVEEGLEV